MKQFIGSSASGSLAEAARGIHDPDFLILLVTEAEQFKEKTEELARMFPNVESIGCVGQGYAQTDVVEKGVIVIGFTGVKAGAGVLTDVSSMPVKRIHNLEQTLSRVGGNQTDTVCIDFCCGNDEMTLTTINSVLCSRGISITGGTTAGAVCCNGRVYEDACVYGIVRNQGGRVKVYKENLYQPTDKRFLVTKSVPDKYIISELDGEPAEKVYLNTLDIAGRGLSDQTFINPLGHCVGDEIYIVAIKESMGDNTFSCYRKVTPKTNLCILQIGDVPAIVDETVQTIHQEFPRISGVFSVNCLFRYLQFQKMNFVNDYLTKMGGLGVHGGLIGYGEHYNDHHTNQTMSCVVFE